MGLGNTSTEFGALAKTLHWLVAIGIFALLYLGLQQSGMERGDERSGIRFIHASIATIILLLMTIRIVWRIMHDVPGHADGMAAWQRMTSTVVHWGLYAAIFMQLLAGAMIRGTAGSGLPVFGLIEIPIPVAESRESHEWWEEIHEFTWKPIAALITLHILGALYNHFILKNNVVRRMTVGVK